MKKIAIAIATISLAFEFSAPAYAGEGGFFEKSAPNWQVGGVLANKAANIPLTCVASPEKLDGHEQFFVMTDLSDPGDMKWNVGYQRDTWKVETPAGIEKSLNLLFTKHGEESKTVSASYRKRGDDGIWIENIDQEAFISAMQKYDHISLVLKEDTFVIDISGFSGALSLLADCRHAVSRD